jgi:hypothetical protein
MNVILELNTENFFIQFDKESDLRWTGKVVEISVYDDFWTFRDNKSSGDVDKIEDARIWFEWSFCWRGVWEGRVYFKDDEYWCEEMETIPLIWKQIEVILKEKIKSENPDNTFHE